MKCSEYNSVIYIATIILGLAFIGVIPSTIYSPNNYSFEQILISSLFWGLQGLTLICYGVFSLKWGESQHENNI